MMSTEDSIVTQNNSPPASSGPIKISIVYHAYLAPHKWRPIVEEQLTELFNTPLYDLADRIFMTVIYDDCDDYQELCNLLKDKWSKINIVSSSKKNTFEFQGILALHTLAHHENREDDRVLLYFHSKGVTSNEHKIRRNLCKVTIQNYQEYLDAFRQDPELDIAGYAPHKNGFIYFNFFWIRSKYIREWCTWPEPTKDRFVWEVWFGNDYSKKTPKTWSPVLFYDQVENKWDELWQSMFVYIIS